MASDVQVSGSGRQIVVDFPSLSEALQFWKPWNDARRRAEITDVLHQALNSAGLSLEVRVQGKAVALLGGAEKAGLILQLLGGARSLDVSR